MRYNLFIGRYQSPHKGHMQIFDRYLSQGLPVLIAIRDTATDVSNPLPAEVVKELWEKVYQHQPLVKVIIIPDIASVNYGRGVGYEVTEIAVDASIANISATEIRKQIQEGVSDWKALVDETIHGLLEERIKEHS
ncbi:MAG: hypothetical protein IPN73_06795 [Saprospiraceae bacterium]|nr:hypothetical protein [Saprospiraceae bacterium]MBK7789031.1 hypothetical protein [Saprospiraceae bacterium]MBK8849856.1 hypothetical protein [Saprospiraceae bacterium]